MVSKLSFSSSTFEADFCVLLDSKREASVDVGAAVEKIIAEVRDGGDKALIALTQKFDRHDADPLRISSQRVDEAIKQCDERTLDALNMAAKRIAAFHEKQKPENLSYTDEVGVKLGYRWSAIQSVGLYVPGGTASYPSSVLMNAIPAKVAGVKRMAMVVPTPDGKLNPLVLAAARISGIDEIYCIGGAQAVAALAYGTETIPPVDKIVGPGNAWVAAAKRQVFGKVGIDMIAGPSEILVVADSKNNPDWIAADLLSQAEHDAAAQSILITDDAAFAGEVEKAVLAQLKTLLRSEIATESWNNHGAIILVENLDQSISLVDRVAPEHLELAIDDPESMASRISNAGSIFLGRYTPEAIGDYVGGPNHVLPTARSARFSSGLGVLDFMKRSTFLMCDANALAALGPSAVALADSEGLTAHGRSVSIRLNQ